MYMYMFVYVVKVVLYDVIIKNFEKLIRPRNSNASSLY